MDRLMAAERLEERRWRAVLSRCADGAHFFYGVLTTGIYCLPGCPSRLPKRKNVVFFDSIRSARAAGLRTCKRCHPDARGIPAWFEQACRALIGGDAGVSDVAAKVGVSRATLHRVTVDVLGIAPSALRRGARDVRLREALSSHAKVLEACFDAGFGSASAAYAQSARAHGAPPGVLRKQAPLELRVLTGNSDLGPMVAAKSDAGLCLLEFLEEAEDVQARVRARFPAARIDVAKGSDRDLLTRAIAAVSMTEPSFALPMDIRGTAFQQQVWAALRTLARGKRVSYSDLAARIGRPSATRAVARAVAENPIAVLVPCHRVVGKNGDLTGYRWGLARKAYLLAREDGGE